MNLGLFELARALPEPMALVDAHGSVVAVNQALAQLLRVSLAEIRGHRLQSLVTDLPEHTSEYLRECSATSAAVFGNLTLRTRTGALEPCRCEGAALAGDTAEPHIWIRFTPRTDALGRFLLLNEQMEQISREARLRQFAEQQLAEGQRARRRAEESVRKSRESLHVALAASNTATFVWNPNGGEFFDLDDNFRELFGFAPGERVRRPEDLFPRIHAEDVDYVAAAVEACRSGADFDREFRVVMPDGKVRWVYARAKFVADSQHSPYLVGAATDLTSRKQVEEALREITTELRAVLDASPLAVLTFDLDRRIRTWHPIAEKLLGWTADEIVGKRLPVSESGHEQWPVLSGRLANGDSFLNVESRTLTKDGREVDVLISGAPIRSSSGEITGLVATIADATEMVRSREMLKKTEKLAAAGRLAATIAHEINNPLEAVTNLLYIARHATSIDRVHEFLGIADQELMRVARIARQTLGFYRDSSSPSRFHLASAIDDIFAVYVKKLGEKGVRIVRRYGFDGEVLGSHGDLSQIVTNIFTNALDASPQGGTLVVRVRRGGSVGGDRHGIHILISDCGGGIERSERSKIFEPFYTTKKDIGTGLGLWVTRELVEKHGGRISIRSTTAGARTGTTVAVYVPLQTFNASAAAASETASAA